MHAQFNLYVFGNNNNNNKTQCILKTRIMSHFRLVQMLLQAIYIWLTSFVRNRIPSFDFTFLTIVIGYSSATSVKLLLPPAAVAISVFGGKFKLIRKRGTHSHWLCSKNVYVVRGTHWFSLYVVGRCLLADLEKHIVYLQYSFVVNYVEIF